MERFHFINNAVCSGRSSGLDLLYSKFAQELYQVGTRQDKHRIINIICQELNNKIASYSDFIANVDAKLYYTKNDEKQKELVKYVLTKMERKKNRHSIPIKTSIEHIYPETPSIMKLKNANLIKNIGNLVLLEDDINSKIGNKEFQSKKAYVLEKTKMIIAKEVFENATDWKDNEIIQRRNNILVEIYEKMWK